VAVAREVNDQLAEIVAGKPDRFQAFAAIPTPDPAAAAAELERAVTQLGFRGAMLYGRAGDVYPDSPVFDDLYATAERLRAPLHYKGELLMILVTGATGQLGSAVIDQLLERTDPSAVAAFVRDPGRAAALEARGVALRIGDYDDTEALQRAMDGVDRVLLIAGTDPQHRVQQHQNVIDAAGRAHVELLGFASRSLRDIEGSGNALMRAYFDTEDRIRRSGIPYVIFRNGLYMDTVPGFVGGSRVFDRGIRLPAGDGKVAYALRLEMGEALANGMIDHRDADRTYVVSAPRAYGFDDLAAALTELSGQAVDYVALTDDEYLAEAAQAGMPEHAAKFALGFFYDIRDNQLDETSADLARLLGHEPVTLTDGLRELFDVERGGPQ
jgi:NAD(P)H dehydrogenase (quinone)